MTTKTIHEAVDILARMLADDLGYRSGHTCEGSSCATDADIARALREPVSTAAVLADLWELSGTVVEGRCDSLVILILSRS